MLLILWILTLIGAVGKYFTQRPGWEALIGLSALGLVLTFLLGMFNSPGLSMMLVCGLLGLGVTLNWRHALTWKITAAGLAMGLISALGTTFLGTGENGNIGMVRTLTNKDAVKSRPRV